MNFVEVTVLRSRIKDMVAIIIFPGGTKIEGIDSILIMTESVNVHQKTTEIITGLRKTEIKAEIIAWRWKINGIIIIEEETRNEMVL